MKQRILNNMHKLIFSAALAGLIGLAHPAAAQSNAKDAAEEKPASGDWSREITRVRHGHLIGNPNAEAKLTAFISYTCSHCATFAKEGETLLLLAYVPSGKVSLEVRHLLRDPVDLTAAMLTQCGDAENFPLNHSAMMHGQDKWMETAQKATQAQRARWQYGAPAKRRRAIASDLGFYDLMKRRGYDRIELDQCLADDEKAAQLAQTSQGDAQEFAIASTPSFLLDGAMMDGVHGWRGLQPALDQYFVSPNLGEYDDRR